MNDNLATNESKDFRIRRATTADAEAIGRHRSGMFVDMGKIEPASPLADAIAQATARMVERTIPTGEWTGWVAEDASGILGGGAVLLRLQPPGPDCPEGGEFAYLLNFYTEPRARRRGVATALVRACLAWCEARGVVRVGLHASADGRRVYERLGFVPREGDMEWRRESNRSPR